MPPQGGYDKEPGADDDGSEDEETTLSFKGRACRFGFSLALLLALLLIGWSKRWQQQLVMASPKELYQVHKTVTALLEGAKPKTGPSLTENLPSEAEPFFSIYGGLWYVRVENLCEPISETFGPLIDAKSCRDRLQGFCEDLRKSMPGVKGCNKVYEKCMERVNSNDGVLIPLLSGLHEISFPWERDERKKKPASFNSKKEFRTLEELEREVALEPGDQDVDFCKTVADCDLLEEMQPWVLAIRVVFYSAAALAALALVLLLLPLVKPSSKAGSRGFCLLMMTLPMLLAVACLYGVMDHKYPLGSLVRTEDLFYFVLPTDAQQLAAVEEEKAAYFAGEASLAELPGNAPAQAATTNASTGAEMLAVGPNGGFRLRMQQARGRSPHSASSLQVSELDLAPAGSSTPAPSSSILGVGIPAARWKGVLVTLTGNLLMAVATGDMGSFLGTLGDAMSRAMKMSEVIIRKWGLYALRTLGDSDSSLAERAKSLLSPLLGGLGESMQELLGTEDGCKVLGAADTCRDAVNQVRASKAQFAQLVEEGTGHVTVLVRIATESTATIGAVMKIVEQVKDPIIHMVNHVKKTFQEEGGDVGAAFRAASDLLMDQDTVQDLKMIFQHVFMNLPKIVGKLLRYVRELWALGKDLYAFFQTASNAVRNATVLMQSLATFLPNIRRNATDVLKMMAMNALTEASANWTEDPGDDSKAGNATVLLELDYGEKSTLLVPGEGVGLMDRLTPFIAGPFKSVASKVGSTFLHEVELMGSERGLRAQKEWSECSWSQPSQCTHFGMAYFANVLVLVALGVMSCGHCMGKV